MEQHEVTFHRESLAKLRDAESKACDLRRQGLHLFEMPLDSLKQFSQAGILQSLARVDTQRA